MQKHLFRGFFSKEPEFILGVSDPNALFKCAFLPTVVLLGYSNVGKSTLINCLFGKSKIARTSRNPGHTRQINIFSVQKKALLADLPGYGYAKRSKAEIASLSNLISNFLLSFKSISLINVLIDIRRGIRPLDFEMIHNLCVQNTPFQIVLTKADCIKLDEQARIMESVNANLNNLFDLKTQVLLFSSKTGLGLEVLRSSIFNALIRPC